MALTLNENVAAEVRAELARHRRTASDLADALGWTKMYLHRRLTCQVPFSVDDLEAIAVALAVPLSKFVAVAS